MSRITLVDLEVHYCVGVTDEERATPQRLLVSIDMSHDFSVAAVSDRLEKTIDCHEVVQDLLKYGDGRNWKLVEKLATNIADMILAKYRPQAVAVEIKKFAIPQARYVAVSLTKTKPR
jgi:7,8-dihydroneopterin aldolase/epimerase/oxygenase